MGLKVKSNRNENDALTFKMDDTLFVFSFDNIEKKIQLNEKSSMILKKAIEGDRKLYKNKKKIVAGDYEVKLNSSEEVNNLWIMAFDKLSEYKLNQKEDKVYTVTAKGIKYFETL